MGMKTIQNMGHLITVGMGGVVGNGVAMTSAENNIIMEERRFAQKNQR